MTSLKTPSRSTKRHLSEMISAYPSWAHPDVLYNESDWRMLRDTYDGEREIKDKGTLYLPQMSSMDADEYATFLENATYFNMTFRTVGALVGTVFKRNPVIKDLPDRLNDKLQTITKKGQSLRSFTQEVTRELVHMGRVGVLVDTDDGGDPYTVMYITESIIDWETAPINGREQLIRVVLMEMEEIEATTTSPRSYKVAFRVLELEGGVYVQKIFRTTDPNKVYPEVTGDPDVTMVPTMRGQTLDHIPFVIFGSTHVSNDVQRSPILDIARMNISHYRSYAQLEHGRYYTGFPVFWASKAAADQTNEYEVGPNRVWELPAGEKAGIMEFNGQGLKFLEGAIETKQAHIAAMGGRIVGVETQAVSESDNQAAMKDRNEQALLLNLTVALDEGFTSVIRTWARWSDTSKAQAKSIEIEFNKDFLLKEVAAREFRAIHSMYMDGVLPIAVVFDYMKRADVIPDWMSEEQFKDLLDSESSFINNPDIEAKKEGFPDAKTKLELAAREKEADAAANGPGGTQGGLVRRKQDQVRNGRNGNG